MYCTKCGKENIEGKFCMYCGEFLGEEISNTNMEYIGDINNALDMKKTETYQNNIYTTYEENYNTNESVNSQNPYNNMNTGYENQQYYYNGNKSYNNNSENNYNQPTYYPQPTYDGNLAYGEERVRKSKKFIVIGVIAVLIVVALCITFAFKFFFGANSPKKVVEKFFTLCMENKGAEAYKLTDEYYKVKRDQGESIANSQATLVGSALSMNETGYDSAKYSNVNVEISGDKAIVTGDLYPYSNGKKVSEEEPMSEPVTLIKYDGDWYIVASGL